MEHYPYGIIGNCTSAALVSNEASIDWLCLPFFDSSSLFSKILDQDKGGYFKIAGVNTQKITQSYIPNTAILKTVVETADGKFEIRDYMPRFKLNQNEYYCPSEIHRDIMLISGRPKIIVELDARPNYALGEGKYIVFDEYLKIISTAGMYNSFYLYTNLDREKIISREPIALTRDTSYLLLSYHEKIGEVDDNRIYVEYEKTKSYWLDWGYRTKVPDKYHELVMRSIITLKLLMFQRTGAVIAAPTTSLPETIGTERTWDYRYCWVRDASMIIDLYARLGHERSSFGFINFVLNRVLLKHENVSVMYGINGERDLEEKKLEHLQGYMGSRPVRVGNDAYRQEQNDMYGELIEMVYTYLKLNLQPGNLINEELWTVVRSLVNQVKLVWRDPDAGIWEFRTKPNHYLHSKLMSWVAMDRAAWIAEFFKNQRYAKQCLALAEEIKADILTKGWNNEMNAFTAYYGSKHLDAANLLMLHYGFLPADDPRMVSTVRKSYEELVRDQLSLRYTAQDDFGSPESAFIVCTFWMINALYLIGEREKAFSMFDNVVKHANYLGLFSEVLDLSSGRSAGNFPQGYSHLAFIQTVLLLETNYNWQDKSRIDELSR
ncbi:MAG: glycoside hydrolase family 15 protein [Candidatus Omnitrophica bacterium]|nr:glycoside hydrolase family 15 protein [Candidatus Omnitrophota bacterium]